MPELSLLVPSRNEQWLARTVADILVHSEADTEVIVVLDGPSPHEPPPSDKRVTVVRLAESIGQRAATNMAAGLSKAKYLMKMDAHCSVDQGFDAKMIADMQDDWVMIPVMKNLWAFDYVCPNGHRRYQSPDGPCKECGEPTTMDIVWQAKNNPQSTSMYFDTNLHFGYWNNYKKRQRGDLVDTMSLIGAFWMVTRERYWALNICDEKHGSWGQMGTEIACKAWLSGGRLVCNKKTWAAHLFRTQGGSFGFPYAISGTQVDKAREYSRWLWLGNNWDKAIYPLSWLIQRFAPIPDWHDESGRDVLAAVTEAGTAFFSRSTASPLILSSTDSANAERGGIGEITGRRQEMPSGAMGLGAVGGGNGIGSSQVLNLQGKSQMEGVTARLVVANDVVEDGDADSVSHGHGADEPCVHQSMDAENLIVSDGFSKCAQGNLSIPIAVTPASPNPAFSKGIGGVNLNSGEQSLDGFCIKSGDCEIMNLSHSIPPIKVSDRLETGRAATRSVSHIIPRNPHPEKSIVYYSDNRLSPLIMRAVQRQLLRVDLPIVSVTLKPMDFGRNIVLPLQRSALTMFKQILAGLEASTADIIYFAEHDVLLHPSHFEFTPYYEDVIFYDGSFYQVDAATGHALTRVWRATSGLCAYRDVLLEHYRKRVAMVETNGYSMKMGYEPGTHHRPERVDDLTHEMYYAEYPSLDLRHGQNLSPTRWRKDQFRNQRYTEGWQEAGEVPGWGQTEGCMDELLTYLANAPVGRDDVS